MRLVTAAAATATAVTAAATTTAASGATAVTTAAATTAATTGTAAVTAAATTCTATKTAATCAGGARLHGTRFVDHQTTATELLAVHSADRCLGFGIAAHFHKAESFGTTGVTLHHDLGAGDRTVCGKCLLQVFVTERIWQIADVKFVAHAGTPQNDSKRDGVQNRNQQTIKDLEQTRN
jgi:hypothetical protein